MITWGLLGGIRQARRGDAAGGCVVCCGHQQGWTNSQPGGLVVEWKSVGWIVLVSTPHERSWSVDIGPQLRTPPGSRNPNGFSFLLGKLGMPSFEFCSTFSLCWGGTADPTPPCFPAGLRPQTRLVPLKFWRTHACYRDMEGRRHPSPA